jgi:hypothetical protein
MTDVFPKNVERHANYVSLFFRDHPNVAEYRLRVADTLNNAYGGPGPGINGIISLGSQFLFDVERGMSFRSRGIRVRKLGILDESTRGQTRILYDPDEYYNPPTTTGIPPDSDIAFLRVQVRKPGGTFPVGLVEQGPILILQTPGWFNVPRPALSIGGNVPNLGALAGPGLQPPDESLEFRIPAYGDSLVMTNLDGALPIFLSMGRGIPMMQVDPGQSFSHTSGEKDSLIMAANGGIPAYSILISTVAGAR